jgi:hypothetical protein
VSSNQDLRAVTEADGGGGPESERRLGVQATLVSLLELAYGARGPALHALEQALVVAGVEHLPDDPADAVAFVRAHLLGPLSADVGPRLTMALIDDLVARFDVPPASAVSSAPPQSMPRPVARVSLRPRSSPPARPPLQVLLVDPDRVGRASLARALMRIRWGVSVVESVDDLRDVLHGDVSPDAVLVDLHHPAAAPILDAVVAALPDTLVVVRGADGPRARSLIHGSRAARFEIRSREAPAQELIEAVKRALDC